MAELVDSEFGTIKLRRSALSRQVRLKLDAGGSISISMPKRTPLYVAKQLLEQSRGSLRQSLQKLQTKRQRYAHGDTIGKSHRLIIDVAPVESPKVTLRQTNLLVTLPHGMDSDEQVAQQAIGQGIEKALRVQAKAYLPRRLQQLAEQYGFTYESTRFGTAGTRWGSCSSRGTISLNVWLMQLPFELIDYVLLHELCHTREMNHSSDFWELVAVCSPDFKQHRKQLKDFQPYA